ncbi:MAG TPA: hypothetical protein V6C84_00640 [Coleofasciculaceae cyanobacterium]
MPVSEVRPIERGFKLDKSDRYDERVFSNLFLYPKVHKTLAASESLRGYPRKGHDLQVMIF